MAWLGREHGMVGLGRVWQGWAGQGKDRCKVGHGKVWPGLAGFMVWRGEAGHGKARQGFYRRTMMTEAFIAKKIEAAFLSLDEAKKSTEHAEDGNHAAFFEIYYNISQAEAALDDIYDEIRRTE